MSAICIYMAEKAANSASAVQSAMTPILYKQNSTTTTERRRIWRPRTSETVKMWKRYRKEERERKKGKLALAIVLGFQMYTLIYTTLLHVLLYSYHLPNCRSSCCCFCFWNGSTQSLRNPKVNETHKQPTLSSNKNRIRKIKLQKWPIRGLPYRINTLLIKKKIILASLQTKEINYDKNENKKLKRLFNW